MRSPAVFGAQSYKELCLAAKNEEKRLSELKKRQAYFQRNPTISPSSSARKASVQSQLKRPILNRKDANGIRKCYICGRTYHIARDCRSPKTESSGSWDCPKNHQMVRLYNKGTARMDLNFL